MSVSLRESGWRVPVRPSRSAGSPTRKQAPCVKYSHSIYDIVKSDVDGRSLADPPDAAFDTPPVPQGNA